MNYKSYAQLTRDIRAWSTQLPTDIVAVAGVPRSGLIPAAQLALLRNIHLVTLDDLRRGRQPWKERLRRGVPGKPGQHTVLVVDDTIDRGVTLQGIRNELNGGSNVLFGAVYYRRALPGIVDYAFEHVPHPRVFEWNLFHCAQLRRCCLDMDGVLCQDWTGVEEDSGPGLTAYLKHLEHAEQFYQCTMPMYAVVTARLEKYRSETEAWLMRHGIKYGELIMSPHETASKRRQASDHALRKAEYFASNSAAHLFIESSKHQAITIQKVAGKPVLCSTTMELFR